MGDFPDFSIVLASEFYSIVLLSLTRDTYFSNFKKKMFGKLISFMAGDYNQKQLNKYLPLIKEINEYSTQFDTLSDDQIKAKTQEFKDRLTA
jgi:hypothetical protein